MSKKQSPPATRPQSPATPSPATLATVEPSRCKKCGSTRRADYHHTHTVDGGGEFHGQPFSRVVFRRTACLDCGQARVDRTYELVAGGG
jgi:hypothetical protein